LEPIVFVRVCPVLGKPLQNTPYPRRHPPQNPETSAKQDIKLSADRTWIEHRVWYFLPSKWVAKRRARAASFQAVRNKQDLCVVPSDPVPR
jgi:hypothetical protein